MSKKTTYAHHRAYIRFKMQRGFCRDCKEEAVPGKQRCEKHLQYNRTYKAVVKGVVDMRCE